MITKQDFILINKEVLYSVEEAFKFLKNNCVDHNYILYLADAEYKEQFKSPHSKLNPYAIDNGEEKYKDESRINFFINFMQTFYSFRKNQNETIDNESKITVELMIYTHIWESKRFLKQLFRLASLASGKSYEWNVVVPEMHKHIYIREDIRNVLKSNSLRIATTISKGFHTSLRNAFAHSEYYLDSRHKYIHLDTYKGGAWDMSEISYDEWTKRFLYTALLSYHFLNVKFVKRKSLPVDFGKDEFLIIHPSNERKSKAINIYYNNEFDSFSFNRR